MLRIDIQSWNDVATLRCSGRVVYGVEVEMLRTMVQSRPEACVRINLAAVDQIDASGLGLLVELQNWAGADETEAYTAGPFRTGLDTGHPHQALCLAGDFVLGRARGLRT